MTARPYSHSSISYFLDDAAEHSSDSSDEEAQHDNSDRESSFIDDDELSENELRERWLTRYIFGRTGASGLGDLTQTRSTTTLVSTAK